MEIRSMADSDSTTCDSHYPAARRRVSGKKSAFAYTAPEDEGRLRHGRGTRQADRLPEMRRTDRRQRAAAAPGGRRGAAEVRGAVGGVGPAESGPGEARGGP